MKSSNKNFFFRSKQGFTLSFAVILCVIFASLLYVVFFFFKINLKESDSAIYREKAIYLAESGNNRALARFNVKTLPDTEGLDFDDEDDFDDDDFFDDDEDDDDFFDDDFFDEFEDDFDEDELDDLFEEDDKSFLAKVPRYINFYLKEPFYVNIDTGAVIKEATYLSLIAQQQSRIQSNKRSAEENGVEYQNEEILIEELYFPLPEVNVSKIGSIPIKKGIHLKPGFKITLAEKMPIQITQESIVNEYFNIVPEDNFLPPKVSLNSISPNYAKPGDYLDVFFEGENFDDGSIPEFSSSDIAIIDYSSGTLSMGISEKAKPGRVEMRLGPNKTYFYIVPEETQDPTAIIKEVLMPKPEDGERQFIKIGSKDMLEGIKITGENLSIKGQPPIIITDEGKIRVDVISYNQSEIVINVETNKASTGLHYFSIFTQGGQSSSWAFNVEQNTQVEEEINPEIGTYTTVAKLLEVLSLSNLPLRSFIEASSSGRPGDANEDDSEGKRPSSTVSGTKGGKRGFDLLKSDLELVWELQTIATVNDKTFKETRIIRRAYPRAEAGLITNSELSFSQSSIILEGFLEAVTILKDPSSSGETTLVVEGEDPDADLYERQNERPELTPSGSAVVEDFYLQNRGQSPSAKGFSKGGIVSVVSASNKGSYSDYAFIKKTGPDTITVEEPGFSESHFIGDEVIQFTPAVLTPEPVRERDAQRNIDPPGAVAYLKDREKFEYIFKTRLHKLISWGGGYTTNTSVPDDFDNIYEGYFGMNVISGVPNYTGSNSLYGQGLLIIDTTRGGSNPSGSTVNIGGSTKLPSMFEGVIYIIGELNINGPFEMRGSLIVNSPRDNSTLRIGGSGNISYDLQAIKKAIIHMPFTDDLRSRIIEPTKSQAELLGNKDKEK